MDKVFTDKDAELFNSLGFEWDRSVLPKNVPEHGVALACSSLQDILATYVFDASYLEGNPFTYGAVQRVVAGRTVAKGYEPSDKDQVQNLTNCTHKLIELVEAGTFALDKKTFTVLHGIVAKEEALEWGNFRGEGQEQHYTPHVGLGMEQDYVPQARCLVRPSSMRSRKAVVELGSLSSRLREPRPSSCSVCSNSSSSTATSVPPE